MDKKKSLLRVKLLQSKNIKIETKKLLYKAISKLTEKQRTVIVLYYFKGLTDIEISKISKTSTQNITFLRLRALKNLKKSLNEYIKK